MKTKYHSTLSTADAKDGDPTRNHSIRRKWTALALGGLLFTSISALLPSPAGAQCQQWSVGYQWRFNQGGRTDKDGTKITTHVDMTLQQKGIVITGTALLQTTYPYKGGFNRLGTGTKGTVDGTVRGNSFAVKIYWDNNTVGVYDGTIRPSGKIDGTGYEQRSRSIKTNWYSESNMFCADAAPVQPKTTTQSQKLQDQVNAASAKEKAEQIKADAELAANNKAAAAEAAKAPPPVLSAPGGEAGKITRPYIRAYPQIVSIPRGANEALTKLAWWAGNDHPNAQVVVEVNGGDESLVAPQRNGSRQVKVKAGRKYVYTLSDAGEPLASVIVQADQPAPPDPQRLRGNQREFRQDGGRDQDKNQGDD